MGTNVHLTPELERFAREVVAEGRYNNVSEVVRQGLRMLQEAEERRRAFTKTLDDAVAEAERDGWISVEDALAEMDAIIDEVERELTKPNPFRGLRLTRSAVGRRVEQKATRSGGSQEIVPRPRAPYLRQAVQRAALLIAERP